MRIALGSDHAGFRYKERLCAYLGSRGHVVTDFGTHSEEPVDYPLFVRPVARSVSLGRHDRGLVVGGSGNGEAMAANRFPRVRCAVCWDRRSAVLARRHNDANMLALGQRLLDWDTARAVTRAWLETPFEGGRHRRRIAALDAPVAGPVGRLRRRSRGRRGSRPGRAARPAR